MSTEYPFGMPPSSISSSAGDAGREALPRASRAATRPFVGSSSGLGIRGNTLTPSRGDPEGVQSRQVTLPAHLHDLELPHDRVALGPLRQPEDAVGDRVHRMVLGLGLR